MCFLSKKLKNYIVFPSAEHYVFLAGIEKDPSCSVGRAEITDCSFLERRDGGPKY